MFFKICVLKNFAIFIGKHLFWNQLYQKETPTQVFFVNITKFIRTLTGKKNLQIKLQCFRKAWIWTFRWLVHQINSLYEVHTPKLNFRKNKVVTGKTPFFVIGSFCTPHSICLNIGFWQISFVWKWCAFSLYSQLKNGTQVFWEELWCNIRTNLM